MGTIQRSIMKIGIIVQARLGSNRLPGKTLMPIDSHGNVLEYVINQIKHNKHIEKIIVATTNNSEDDKIIPYEDAKLIAKNYKNATLISTKGSGHGLKSEAINKHITTFINEA